MKFRVRYRRARVTVEGKKPHKCSACPARGRVELHHHTYKYTTAEVRKNPQLALENTIPFCYTCHRIADMFRKLAQDQARTRKVCDALMKGFSEEVKRS